MIVSEKALAHLARGDPHVIGQTLTVTRTTFTVVGSTEPVFDGLSQPVDRWLPLPRDPRWKWVSSTWLVTRGCTKASASIIGGPAAIIKN